MTTSYDTDPNTQTVAAAWASSPLGQPDHDGGFGVTERAEYVTSTADPAADERRPVFKHAIVALALAGIAVGAALGLTFADFTSDQQTVVVPDTTSPRPAAIVNPSVQTPSPTVAGQGAAAPAPVASAIPIAPTTATLGTPPASTVGDPTEVADAPVPADPSPAAETPAAEEPADPNPQPPVDPDPQPKFPNELDLKLAPSPGPEPKPTPMPDFDISTGTGS